MLKTLITILQFLIILSYFIVGLYLIDLVETRFIYMTNFDILICTIGSIFIMFSFYILFIIGIIRKD